MKTLVIGRTLVKIVSKIDNGTIFTGDDQDVELDKLKLDQTGINYESMTNLKYLIVNLKIMIRRYTLNL
jgi:hypothetical protein